MVFLFMGFHVLSGSSKIVLGLRIQAINLQQTGNVAAFIINDLSVHISLYFFNSCAIVIFN